MSSAMRRSTSLPVPRSYSTQAEVSARITRCRPGRCRQVSLQWHVLRDSERLVASHRLPGEMAQREIHGFGLGVDVVAIHHCPENGLFDLDIGPKPAHTPMIHMTCRRRVEAGSARCARFVEPGFEGQDGPELVVETGPPGLVRVPAGSHGHRVEVALVPETGLGEEVFGPAPQRPAQPLAEGRIETRLGAIKQVTGYVPF